MAASRARRASTNTARIPSAKKSASPKPPMKKPLTDALHPRPKRPAPLFDRLELTSIHVTNMDRAVAFYRDTLGLRAAQIWPNWAEFPLKDGVLLGVHLETDCDAGGRRSGGATGLYFQVTGIRRVVTELRKRGVAITGEVTRHSYGTVAYFTDGDGNEFGLIEGGL